MLRAALRNAPKPTHWCAGESYAGHYVPAVASRVFHASKSGEVRGPVALAGWLTAAQTVAALPLGCPRAMCCLLLSPPLAPRTIAGLTPPSMPLWPRAPTRSTCPVLAAGGAAHQPARAGHRQWPHRPGHSIRRLQVGGWVARRAGWNIRWRATTDRERGGASQPMLIAVATPVVAQGWAGGRCGANAEPWQVCGPPPSRSHGACAPLMPRRRSDYALMNGLIGQGMHDSLKMVRGAWRQGGRGGRESGWPEGGREECGRKGAECGGKERGRHVGGRRGVKEGGGAGV